MGKETILVVEDNRQIAHIMADELLLSMGFETAVAYDGASALAVLEKRPFSLILLDLQLPDINGLDLLRCLAEREIHIPTILVTAHGSEAIAVEAFHLGVHDYLVKPVDADQLSEAIGRALAESRLQREKGLLNSQLQEQISWLMALSRVGQSVISTLDVNDVLRRIVDAAVTLTRAEEGFLALLDDPGGQLYLRAAKNIDENQVKTMRLLVSDSLVGKVVSTGRPLRIARPAEGALLKVSTGFLVHSLLYVPVSFGGKVLGVLSVDNRGTQRPFGESDEALLVALADYAAIALENARLYQQAQLDILERKRAEQALREAQERYALAVSGANDGLWDWDLKTHRIYFSPRWKAMLGYGEDEIATTPAEWLNRIHPEDVARFKMELSTHIKGLSAHLESECRMLHKDGSYRWMLCRGQAVWDKDGHATRMAGSQTDITDRKYAEQKLLHNAFYDTLTGLANRALFMDRLRYAVERAKRRDDYRFAVLFLDLDRFKDVNDSMGHQAGDQLLKSVAVCLQQTLRPTDTVARLGGDEFVILLEDITEISDATHVADRIQSEFFSLCSVGAGSVYVTASIGIVSSQSQYGRAEDILRDADIAMYRAKAQGKARYEVFDPTMRDRLIERLTLENDLRAAIERQQLCVFYQPIVSLKTGKVFGFEALVRWRHPSRGLLEPEEFISLAEETGIIIALDRWVWTEACRQLKAWQREFPALPPLAISVNLSGKQVAQNDLLPFIEAMLKETGLDPQYFKIEITESNLTENNERSSKIFNGLRSLGVQIQIDDFGVGYSSLSYLSHFPVNALKIDRTFVAQMNQDNNNLRIVQAIVMLTHGLGIGVVAEGVENEAQVEKLSALGCEYGQGVFASMPIDSDAAGVLVSRLAAGVTPFPPGQLSDGQASPPQVEPTQETSYEN